MTDSELLFAYLLSRLDAEGCADAGTMERTDTVLTQVTAELCAVGDIGSLNFVLSNGEVLYAHRFGRPLLLLERAAEAGRSAMVLVASEAVTAEPWTELADGALLRCEPRGRSPLRFLRGNDPRVEDFEEQEELPFTD